MPFLREHRQTVKAFAVCNTYRLLLAGCIHHVEFEISKPVFVGGERSSNRRSDGSKAPN